MGQIVTNPEIPNRVNEGTPKLFYLADGAAIFGCIGDPEDVITANKRSLALSDDGNIYFKTTDGVATGWINISGGGGGGTIGGSIASTQIAVGSGVDTITGYSALTYDDVNALFFLTKSINAPASLAVTNSNAGTSAIAQVAASANSAQAVLFATSSAYITSGLYEANMSVLSLNGSNASLIRGNSAGSLRFALGTSEYARLTSARLGLLSLGLGATVGSLDVLLERDAANTLAQRNGTNAQGFRIYNTYTDASNYERFGIAASATKVTLDTSSAGTGAARILEVGTRGSATLSFFTNNTDRWQINSSGHFLPATDNTYDIGGATRPRNVYVANTVYSSAFNGTLTSGYIGITSRFFLDSAADGVVRIANDTQTDFSRLQFGGTTSSFPALGRSGASVVVQLADGTLQTPILPVNTNQLQFGGADAASPGAISLRAQNVVAGTSNTSGQNLSIFGSAGTGNAGGGAILLRVAPAGSAGSTQNPTIVGLAIDGTGRLYASAIHNNAAGMAGSTNQYIGSGTYTPTLSNVANVASSSTQTFQYIRVGNVVTVSGWVTVDPTSATTLTRLGITLPISSNFTQAYQCNGTGAAPDVTGYSGSVMADTTNDRAELNFTTAVDVADRVWQVFFQYEVL